MATVPLSRVRVHLARGLYCHEAEVLSRFARRFACGLWFLCGGRRANAKSVAEVVELAADPGCDLVLEADGGAGREALAGLAELVAGELPETSEDFAFLDLTETELEGIEALPPRECLGALGLIGHGPADRPAVEALSGRDGLETFGLLAL